MMYKKGLPYACLLIETHEGYFICVPFRTSIRHKNAFLFKESERSKKNRSGLDYSKIVIIQDTGHIDSNASAVIDQDEYAEFRENLNRIVREAVSYVNTYINHKKGTNKLHDREYLRKYRYSTLPYFDAILGV